jgi:hypothetical protein
LGPRAEKASSMDELLGRGEATEWNVVYHTWPV